MTNQLYCTGCFGPINGPAVYIHGLPYHSVPRLDGKGNNRSDICCPPPAVSTKPRKPIPGQINLDGEVAS
jgi:hypothetical protein